MELDRIRKLLCNLATSHGMTDADLNKYNEVTDDFEWHINWKKDLTVSLHWRLQLLEDAVNLYDAATARDDRLTAKAALIDAGVQLQSMTSFFDGITHDVKKAYGEPRFNWPKFPDDNWKIPPEYGYKG